MRVITFQDRFAELVRLGTKTQTIRKSARCKPGDTLSLRRWTGKPYRSKQEALRTVVCSEVVPIRIEQVVPGWWLTGVAVNGRWLTGEQRDELAIEDGFVNFETMYAWFYHYNGLPFYGHIIKWNVPLAAGTTGEGEGAENIQ
jgi:hypothetical protein